MQDIISNRITVCQYEPTCDHKTDICWENTMTELYAKTIIDNKFWIVEENGEKIATLRKNEDL